MSRLYLIILYLTACTTIINAQFIESFDTFPAGTSYESGEFVSSNNIKWYYNDCKGGQSVGEVKAPAICLNKAKNAQLVSDSIYGGCTAFSFIYEQEYTTSCNASVYINNEKIGDILTNNQADIPLLFKYQNAVCETFVIKILQNSSSSGQLTIDSICWKSFDCNSLPIRILSDEVVNNTLIMTCSKPVGSLILKEHILSDIDIASFNIINNTIELNFDVLQCGNHNIHIRNNEIDTVLSFISEKQIEYGDVVLNEIMVDPTPPVDQFNSEYLELYNRTNCIIDLSNWILKIGESEIFIGDTYIQPESYIVICDDSSMCSYVESCIVTSLTLPNSGGNITLFDPIDNPISNIEYADNWWTDPIKKDGGWALEKIDPDNFFISMNNWTESISFHGGTPGAINSVSRENPDTIFPHIISAFASSDSTIEIIFDEYCIVEKISSYNELIIDSCTSDLVKHTLYLHLDKPLANNVIYNFNINNISDMSGNVASYQFKVAIPDSIEQGDILLNEILFNPYPGEYDFIELYNNSFKVLDLHTMYIANCDMHTAQIKDYYACTPFPYLLFPGEYVVLAEHKTSIISNYVCSDTILIVETSLPNFNDDEGCVSILSKGGYVYETFNYYREMHHYLYADVEGVSLERISFLQPATDSLNWHSASELAGFATPGYVNSQHSEGNETKDAFFSCDVNVFSPNNDGYHDYLIFHYNSEESGMSASIFIFNENGVPVRQLYNNVVLGTEGDVIWDGTDDSGNIVPNGIYIFICNVMHLNGTYIKEKHVCAKGM